VKSAGGSAARSTVGESSVDTPDAVVLAVADEILRKGRIGEATRARVAAAIAQRLAVLREKGVGVSVRRFDSDARPGDGRGLATPFRRSETARSR